MYAALISNIFIRCSGVFTVYIDVLLSAFTCSETTQPVRILSILYISTCFGLFLAIIWLVHSTHKRETDIDVHLNKGKRTSPHITATAHQDIQHPGTLTCPEHKKDSKLSSHFLVIAFLL